MFNILKHLNHIFLEYKNQQNTIIYNTRNDNQVELNVGVYENPVMSHMSLNNIKIYMLMIW